MPITSDPVLPSRSTRPSRARPSWAGLLALASIPLAVGCADLSEPEVAYDPPSDLGDAAVDEDLGLAEKGAIVVSTEKAKQIAAAAPKSASGIPLWESRPGARVALFLDFDGGQYGGQTYRGWDADGNRSRFGTSEQTAMIRAALEVVEGYKGYNINVTTSYDAMRKAPKWGWILITDDETTSGEAYIGVIKSSSPCSGSSCVAKGFAGSEAVFNPPSAQRGYLLIHELGHQFGLNHSGLYKNGVFKEWSELRQSRTSDWMGGRDSYFSDYKWTRSQTKRDPSQGWQDPVSILTSIAGTVDGGGDPGGGDGCHTVSSNHSDYCTESCRCNVGEGDCDRDTQCATGLICKESGTVDVCATKPGGESCHTVPANDSNYCTSTCTCKEGEGDCDNDSQCAAGLICQERGSVDRCEAPSGGTPPPQSGGRITHIGTTQVWDSDGVDVRISRPSGVTTGDLLVLFTHRTDSRLPYEQSGWSRVAHCYKVDNGYDCDSNVTSSSRDLAQVVYVKRAASEPSSYTFNFGRAHPAWVILTALRGADTSNPVRDWANTGCDGSSRSVFPSVDGVAGDMVLMSQSYDDAVSKSRFGAPSGASTFGYVSNSDEAGFLFGRVLSSSGRTGSMTTTGAGASSCKDGLVTLAIRPR